MRELVKNELGYLKSSGFYILVLLIALEIVGLLLEDFFGLFFVSYFIFPAIILGKYRNRDIHEINLFNVYIKMLIIYFLIIPIYLAVHVVIYKKIGFNMDNMVIINSVVMMLSTIFYGIQITLLKKHGAEKAGNMSLRIIAFVVACAGILLLINLIYCMLIVGRDLLIVQFIRKLFRQWMLIYMLSAAILSISYSYGKEQYNIIAGK